MSRIRNLKPHYSNNYSTISQITASSPRLRRANMPGTGLFYLTNNGHLDCRMPSVTPIELVSLGRYFFFFPMRYLILVVILRWYIHQTPSKKISCSPIRPATFRKVGGCLTSHSMHHRSRSMPHGSPHPISSLPLFCPSLNQQKTLVSLLSPNTTGHSFAHQNVTDTGSDVSRPTLPGP